VESVAIGASEAKRNIRSVSSARYHAMRSQLLSECTSIRAVTISVEATDKGCLNEVTVARL
jgi:hypothetical protein